MGDRLRDLIEQSKNLDRICIEELKNTLLLTEADQGVSTYTVNKKEEIRMEDQAKYNAKEKKEEAPRLTPRRAADYINRFTYHPPRPELNQAARYESIREKGRQLALYLADQCPDSRELSKAITKLEEAIMWANSAIARHE